MRRLLGFGAFSLGALWAPAARADLPQGWYWLAGGNLGAVIHESAASAGFLIGAEGSIVYHADRDAPLGRWIGFYSDALVDIGNTTAFRYSVGPELGFAFVGLDAGYSGAVHDGAYYHGLVTRLVLTTGVLALYGRWGHYFGDDSGYRNLGEVGILIKYVDVNAFGLLARQP